MGANEDLDSIPKQFISVIELLEIFASCENMTHERAARWFINNIQILNRTKKLILKNEYTLVEYEQNDNDFYGCPIDTLRLIADGGDYDPFNDCVGFARKRILVELKKLGFNIAEELIKNTPIYISQSCSIDDDNFYKNQCIDLRNEMQQALRKEPTQKQKKEIQFINFLDKNSTQYNAKISLIARIHHDLNYLCRYSDERIHWQRIKMFLEEYSASYGFTATDTHAKAIAQILPSRADSQVEANKAVKTALLSK